MTLITRSAAAVLVAAVLLSSALPGSEASPARARHVDPLDQHIAVHTRNTAGQRLDPMFFGRWRSVMAPSPVLVLKAAGNRAETTSFRADTPAPNLVRPGRRGYCLVQDYRVTTGDPVTPTARYASTLVVRRHGRVVLTSRVAGDYLAPRPTGDTTTGYTYGPVSHHRHVRFAHFRFRRHDHVTWVFSGRFSNQIDRLRSQQTVTATC